MTVPYQTSTFDKVVDDLFQNVCRVMEPFESYKERMTYGEQMMIHLWALSCEAANGGIHQFLWNSSGDYAEETIIALELVGANDQMKQLRKIQDVVFSGKIPKCQDSRTSLLLLFDGDEDNLTPDEYETKAEASKEFYDKIDNHFGFCDDITNLASKYITENPSTFSRLSTLNL